MTVHFVVVTLAMLAVTFAARFPGTPQPAASAGMPTFALSGVTGSSSVRTDTFFRPGTSLQTRESISALVARPDVASVRSAGAVSPASSFSAGVSAAAASSGEEGAGVKPLADIVDPRSPIVEYVIQPGDTISGVAAKFGIKMSTLLDNNKTVENKDLLPKGLTLVVPRKDGILHKVGSGETVETIAAQYDNITPGTIVEYKPNAITDPKSLETGRYLLLVGATPKPPPPPPPAPVRSNPGPGGTATGSGSPRSVGGGRFSALPLANWHGVSDPFGSDRGAGRIHEGIDLDLWGLHSSNIFSVCNGVVSRTEYLTYSYGYHVIVDCGGGWTTLYAHMSQINVSPGQQVSAGTVLGISGVTGYTTGEHLHFEIRYNGAPVDPADYLPF